MMTSSARWACVLTGAWLWLAQSAAVEAIDKGDFKDLTESQARAVIDAFQVPVYYPKGQQDGGALTMRFHEQHPKCSAPIRHAQLVLFDPKAAQQLAQSVRTGHTYRIQAVAAGPLLEHMYQTRHDPVAGPHDDPDVILFQDLRQLWMAPEYLAHPKTHEPMWVEAKGQRFVPMFLDRQAAIEVQKQIAKQDGFEPVRIGISPTHQIFGFIVRQHDKGVPVRVVGYPLASDTQP